MFRETIDLDEQLPRDKLILPSIPSGTALCVQSGFTSDFVFDY